jgi:hypothetical protein
MPFWNAPEIKRLRKFIGRAFLLWLAALCIDYYVHDSGWYPQQRKVAVFFDPSDWIGGEIRTCYSILFNGEFFGIDCSLETQETKRDRIRTFARKSRAACQVLGITQGGHQQALEVREVPNDYDL